MISVERLHELLDYEPETGIFRWKIKRGNARSGAVAGTLSSNGYRRIAIDRRAYPVRRLAWLYVYSHCPAANIKSINGVRDDDRLSNLREKVPVPEGPLTAERLREVLDYDAETGVLYWKISQGKAKAGSIAGSPTTYGYQRISVDGQEYFAHRLAWLHTYGVWPDDEVDHKYGVRDDNRLVHLRAANRNENKHNSKPSKNNISGYKGVSWHSKTQKWRAQIKINGRHIFLGFFNNPRTAALYYDEAARQLFGKFARTNAMLGLLDPPPTVTKTPMQQAIDALMERG